VTWSVTPRLVTAVLITAAGGLLAVVSGRAEAAVLALPWAVLLVLGLTGSRPISVRASLAADRDRVVVGGPVTVTAILDGVVGWAEVRWRPPKGLVEAAVTDPGTGPDGVPAGWGGDGPDDDETDPAAGRSGHRPGPGGDGPGGDGRGGDGAAGDGPEGDESEPVEEVTARADVADRRGRVVLACTLAARSWGAHDVGRFEVRVGPRYGLTVASGMTRQALPIRVHPRPIDLQRLLAPWYVRRLTGAHRSRATGRGVEYVDIRPFGSGDSLRDINWRASARSEQLLVSRRHPDRSTHVVLLLDSFVDSGHDVRTMLGEAIEAAVALAESHLAVSDRVGLVELGGVTRWVSPGAGRHHLQRLVDALLATRLFRSEADRPVSIVPPRALPPRSFVVALSPLLDRRFIEALGVLRAGGHDVAVVEFPPPLDETSPRWNRTDLSPAALRLWLAEREALRDRLAERGVAVAARQPGQPWDPVLDQLATVRRLARGAVRA
jgi:uncharacterized protein (DUF58 family)